MEPNQATIDQLTRYLLHEASEAEKSSTEQSFFEDDDLFYSLLELENDLTDKYAARKMVGAERERFEASLSVIPSRRQKVANALALREVILHETFPAKDLLNPTSEPESTWKRFINALNAQKEIVGVGAASLILVTGIGIALVGIAFLSSLKSDSPTAVGNTSSAPPPVRTPSPRPSPPLELRPNTAQRIVDLTLPQGTRNATIRLVVPAIEAKSPFQVVLDDGLILESTKFKANNDRETGLNVNIPIEQVKKTPHKIVVNVGRGRPTFEYHFQVRP